MTVALPQNKLQAEESVPSNFSNRQSTVKEKPKRILELDILRGIAILLVLFHHAVIPGRESGFLKIPLTLLTRLGWTGVDLFFVLSGSLIGTLLFKEINRSEKLNFSRFYTRRALRLWPAYYLMVGCSFILSMSQGLSIEAAQSFLPNLVHVQNYFPNAITASTWSLAVEEHFYLLLPLLVVAIISLERKTNKSVYPAVGFAVMVACLVVRSATTPSVFSALTCYFPTH